MCGTAPATPSDAASRVDPNDPNDDDDDAKTTTATASAIDATQSAIAVAFTRDVVVDDDDDGDASASSGVERDGGGMSKAWCSPTAPVDGGIAARIDARKGCSRLECMISIP